MSTMLAHYDVAMKALSTALNSKDVTVVLKGRDDLELMKRRAKQVKDRQLLADATEFQMRVERWLGVLLIEAKKVGSIAEGRVAKGSKVEPNPDRVTLKEIGIDRNLSAASQRAASMNDAAFEDRIREVRSTVTLGRKTSVSKFRPRASQPHNDSPFDYLLSDGTPIGRLRIGKLKSRIDQLVTEARILSVIATHAGEAGDQMATVQDTVSAMALDHMISSAAGDSDA